MNFVLDTNAVSETEKPLHRKFRVLNFDSRAAAFWGEMTARASGPLPLRDSFIAAIVRSRG